MIEKYNEIQKQYNIYDDSKECKTCKYHDSIKIECNHPYWDKCIKRDDNEFIIDYLYHEYLLPLIKI
jgi:hypothetical protein